MCQDKRNWMCAFCPKDDKCQAEREHPLCHLCQREGVFKKASHLVRVKDEATMGLCDKHFEDYSKYGL